jgi:phosphonate transport system substrate-binding protein
MSPHADRSRFRLLLPPSLGAGVRAAAASLESWVESVLGVGCEVSVAQDYRALCAEVLALRADAAWAPPYVCAQLEAMGARVLARVVRQGCSSYRAALVCRANEPLRLEQLNGKTAAWVDRDSVAGYLLPMAFLKSRGIEPAKTFFNQKICGSYPAAAEAVLEGEADVTSVFAPPGAEGDTATGLSEVVPTRHGELQPFAFTDEAPNDGIVLGMALAPELQDRLGSALIQLNATADGQRLLKELFNAERFELAPRLGYRALYRVALATV